jgi:hypothetical protein
MLVVYPLFHEGALQRGATRERFPSAPSRRAALPLGFTFEGIFRQHLIVKGRNRDSAWYSMLDTEWPMRRTAFERWLDPANFDAEGRQRVSLSMLNEAHSVA